MKTKLFIFSLLMAICTQGFSQDIIHTFDSAPIEAKVLEIGESSILYKAYNNPDGPNYRMSVDRIVRIVFENGTERVFARPNLFATSPYRYDYSGPIHYRWGHYYDRRGRLYADQLRDYLGVSLYGSDYLKADRQLTWGLLLTITGATVLVGSLVAGSANAEYNRSVSTMNLPYHMQENAKDSQAPYFVAGLVGAACLGTGITLWIKGDRKLNAIADDYNQRYGSKNYGYRPSLNLGSTGNGIGLALNF
jgi:hypothetical protein